MRGRPPKPVALRDAQGDTRKIGARKLRRQIAAEPKAVSGLPPCPRHLKGLARTTWQMAAVEIAGMGLDKRPDGQMLEGFCVAYAQAVAADRLIARDGMVLKISKILKETIEEPSKTEPGVMVFRVVSKPVVVRCVANPAVAVSRASWKQVLAFGAQFGLSPVARARITIEKPSNAGQQELLKALGAPRPVKAKILTAVN